VQCAAGKPPVISCQSCLGIYRRPVNSEHVSVVCWVGRQVWDKLSPVLTFIEWHFSQATDTPGRDFVVWHKLTAAAPTMFLSPSPTAFAPPHVLYFQWRAYSATLHPRRQRDGSPNRIGGAHSGSLAAASSPSASASGQPCT